METETSDQIISVPVRIRRTSRSSDSNISVIMVSTTSKASDLKPNAAVLTAGMLWGTSCLFVKSMSALGMTSGMQAVYKVLISGIFYVVLLLLTDRSKLKIRLRDAWIFAVSGLFCMAGFTWLHYYTLIHGQASVSIALIYTSPAFVVVASAILFKEKITGRKLTALCLTVAGCALTAGAFSEQYRTPPFIAALCILAGFLYGMYSICAKFATRTYHPLTFTTYTFLFAILFTIPFGDVPGSLALMKAHPVLILLCLGKNLVCTVTPYFLYTWGISRIEAGKAAIFAAADPLMSCVLGILVLQEPANADKIAGIALILAAVILVNSKK